MFVFALRNREQVDFAEYMRNKYHYMNQGTGGPNMGGPSNGGSYNGSDNFQRPKDPFGEFSNKKDNPEEPFGEFDKDDKDKR